MVLLKCVCRMRGGVFDVGDGFEYCRNFDFKEFYRNYTERFV